MTASESTVVRGQSHPWVEPGEASAAQAVEDALQLSEERMRLAVESADIGLWDWDLRTNRVYFSLRWKRLLGYEADEFDDGFAAFIAQLHPEDQPRVVHDFRAQLERSGPTFQSEFRLRHKDGAYRWVQTRASVLRDAQGNLQRMLGATMDITKRRRAEDRAAALLQIAEDISGTLDHDVLIQRVQQRTAHVLQCPMVLSAYRRLPREAFKVRSQYGVPEALLDHLRTLEFPPSGPFEQRVESGETVVLNDISLTTPLVRRLCEQFGIVAAMVAPLPTANRNLGTLIALRTAAEGPFDPSDADLLAGIARQLSVAIEGAEVHRAREEEAHISVALARVGQELISALDTPVLLERVCRLTTEVLECQSSRTWLWRPEENAYAMASSYGDTPEERESTRLLRLAPASMTDLLGGLKHAGVVEIRTADFSQRDMPALARQMGITIVLYMALQRGPEVIGFQTAAYRGRQEPCTPRQTGIARGIAQLASLALQNATLVEQLEHVTRIKSDFVATMSHELRTPLNVIIGYSDLVLEGAMGSLTPEQIDSLGRVHRSARELLELVNTTLDLSRIEAGQQPLQLGEIAVQDLIAELDAETREAREHKPAVRVEWKLAPGIPRLRTDPVKLKLVMKNLLTNAIKFTAAGSVTIAVRRHDTGVEFCVTDTGIGIAPEAQKVIFEAFTQADSSVNERYGGVGLGLYIVRRLLDLLGGTIAVDSRPGRGSIFLVWVPIRVAETARPT